MARNFAIGLGLPVESVKSFGFSKDSDYKMRGIPEMPHYHPAKALGLNGVPDQFDPGKVHDKLDRFDITLVGQTPEEIRAQTKLLIDVAMKAGDSRKTRNELKMPLLVYAVGSSEHPYHRTFDIIEPIKGPVEKAYGKDAVRYIGFNIESKK